MPEKRTCERDQDQETMEFEPQEALSTTQHTVTIAGQEVAYTATAGTLVLKEESGGAKAAIFFVAYTRDEVEDPAQRPITFAFNGGPGSSSVWLHLGLFGPRRVQLFDKAGERRLPPPGRLINNAHSLLDVTDLVFVDPVTTGYSRATSEKEAKEFHAFEKDIEAVGEFIRLYTTRFQRWASPKYLAGESYGTTRAAGLAGYLQNRQGMYLNGILLISTVLNFQTLRFDVGNDLPYQLFLPTYAATAWYHQQLADDLQERPLREFLDEVEAFVRLDYVPALLKGDALPPNERATIAEQVARYTGLNRAYVEHTDLRLEIFRFTKELLRKERRTVGRLDSRFTAVDRDAAGEKFEFDPSYALIQGPFTAMLNHYVRAELGFESDLPYEILTGRVQPWDYGEHQNQYVNVAETLRQEISRNPHLRVFVANGYYDLATPYAATEYTFNHLQMDAALRDNITLAHYASGHMIYIHEPSLAELRQDLINFGF